MEQIADILTECMKAREGKQTADMAVDRIVEIIRKEIGPEIVDHLILTRSCVPILRDSS